MNALTGTPGADQAVDRLTGLLMLIAAGGISGTGLLRADPPSSRLQSGVAARPSDSICPAPVRSGTRRRSQGL